MKHFLLNLGAFLVILILIIFSIIFIMSEKHEFKPSTYYSYNEFNRAFLERDYDLIALGNSKLIKSIDKDILQTRMELKSTILGYTASNISVSRLTLESYLNKCVKKPKIVLFEVSWFSFNQNRTNLYNITGDLQLKDPSMFKYFFRYGIKYRNNYFQALKKQFLYTKEENKINYLKQSKVQHLNKKTYNFDLLGFESFFPNHFAGFNNLLMEDFYEIVSICKKNDIDLILYTAPEDREYSLNQKDRYDVKKVYYDLSSLNEKIIYLDYTLGGVLYDEKFEFWLEDSHHIYQKELFTKKLVKDIKKTKLFKIL